MSKNPNQKLKLLYLYQILLQRTDENHKLTTDELRAALERCGITAERKSIYSDIEAPAAAITSRHASLNCPSSSCSWMQFSAPAL